MKKILLACGGDHFPQGALEFAAAMNKHEKIWLKGFFLPSMDYSRLPSFAYANDYETGFIPPDFYDQEEKIMNKHITQFQNVCEEHAIAYKVYKHTGFESLQGLIDETRFSDIALVESRHFFSAMDSTQPNAEMNQLLHDTECPVLLLPEKFEMPGNVIFAYDGEDSCMAAIKQFSLLMTGYTGLPLALAYFSSSSEEKLPYDETVTEYIRCHYRDFTIKISDSESAKDLDSWIAEFPNPMIITGSYSRSGLSRVFKKSFISAVIANDQFPVFLFHGNKK